MGDALRYFGPRHTFIGLGDLGPYNDRAGCANMSGMWASITEIDDELAVARARRILADQLFAATAPDIPAVTQERS